MKKHLFLLSSVFALFSLQAQQATMSVASNTNVKVKPGTTLFVGGEMKVAEYTNSNKVSNQGNIKITGKLTNQNSSGSNFVNEFTKLGETTTGERTSEYGQLIVSQSGENTGKIQSVVKPNQGFVYHSLAVPYEGVTAFNLVKQLYATTTSVTDEKIGDSFVGYRFETGSKKYFDKNRKLVYYNQFF